mgnify:CR=1 FL=1
MSEPGECRFALVQMEVRGGDLRGNLKRASELIEEAAKNGADVAILPECMDLGWTDPSSREGAGEIPGGEACQALRKLAQEYRISLCSGLTERSGDEVYNAAVIIDPSGEIVGHHRKIHELDIAHSCYARGDRLRVTETCLGTWGLMICADGFVPGLVLSRSLAMMGAEVILSPCAWAVPGDHDNEKEPYGDLWRESYGPVAKEFSVTIIGVSNVGEITGGPWQGRNCIGNSLVIGPDGEELLQGPHGVDAEAILYFDWRGGVCREW